MPMMWQKVHESGMSSVDAYEEPTCTTMKASHESRLETLPIQRKHVDQNNIATRKIAAAHSKALWLGCVIGKEPQWCALA